MIEEIGKVKIDYSRYSGEDLYCDGAVEDELLDIVKNRSCEEYGEIIEQRKDWPLLYHLSPLRENIVDWIPMEGMGSRRSDVQKTAPEGENAEERKTEKEEPEEAASGGKISTGQNDLGKEAGRTADFIRKGISESSPRYAKVLEVGSGCGAITGALARKAGSVTCVELSKKRSLINAYRHRDLDNVTIHVGNFKDIEPDLPKDFDYIFLIGVFEYAKGYIGGDKPYEDFLKILLPHLAPGGRMVIAIENKYGLKYFAGCREDHLGSYFSGIENYAEGGDVRTFGRNGLERIFKNCGVGRYHFYYPYPDYKFMTMMYSDDYLPGKGELSNNLRNFDRDRLLLFDEKEAFDGLIEEGLFPFFSNSFLVVIGNSPDIKYVKYSNDRAPEYAIRTEIRINDLKGFDVRKYPMSEAAGEHVKGMAAAYESLRERYRGGGLDINRCELVEEKASVYARFEFVQGVPLSELMDRCLEKDDVEGFHQYFRQYVERIGYNSEYPAADFDLIFANILVSSRENSPAEKWTLIDYEWTFGKHIDTKELAFRAVYCYLQENEKRNKCNLDLIMKELSVTEEEAEGFREQEKDFQQFVTGGRASMRQMRDFIDNKMIDPQKWIEKYRILEQLYQIQIYEDRGNGYSEETSYFVRDACQKDGLVEMELAVNADVKMLRIDPCMCPCVVKLCEMSLNGTALPLDKRKVLYANGRIVKPAEKEEGKYCPSIVFATEDPNVNVALGNLKDMEENKLRVKMEVVRLPMSVAKDLEEKGRLF